MTVRHLPTTLCELADLLDVTEETLTDLAVRADRLYRLHRRRKSSGRLRTLHVPHPDLRRLQRLLNRRVLARLPVSRAAHGFVRGRSIADAARHHVGQACVVRIDLRNFFPSIQTDQIFGALIAAELSVEIADLIARLTTHRGRLPQGAPTSPTLSNLAFRPCDAEITGLSRRLGIRYSRYADDLIFSGSPATPRIIEHVREIVESAGFEIHPGKTRVQRRGVAQRVLGLTVNDRLGVSRRERRILRAACHHLTASDTSPDSHRLTQLRGHVAHIASAAPDQATPLRRSLEDFSEGV